MLSCDECRELITAYVDNHLTDNERHTLQQHLYSCENCRHLADTEQETHDALKPHYPLFKAPSSLEKKVQLNVIARDVGSIRNRNWLVLAASLVCLTITLLIVWRDHAREKNERIEVSQFAYLAVDTHMRRIKNQLPLEVVSESPEVISQWFSNKVNFHFELPNYPVTPGYNKTYLLEGARLVSFNNDYAANVSYRMKNRLISLVVISENLASPSGGNEVEVGDIRFHIQDYLGFHVITWSHRSLTYALVSDLDQTSRGQDSCMVCHQETEKDMITLHP